MELLGCDYCLQTQGIKYQSTFYAIYRSSIKGCLLKMGSFWHKSDLFYFMERSCSDLEIFNFLQFKPFHWFKKCDVMMGISTQGRVHFLACLLNLSSPGHETHPVNRYSHGQQFCMSQRIGSQIHILFKLPTYHK